jgi:hypothetical protein
MEPGLRSIGFAISPMTCTYSSDGNATGVFSTAESGTFLLIERVPTNLGAFTQALGEAASGLGGLIDGISIASAAVDGWKAAEARGESPPMTFVGAIASAAPQLGLVALDRAAYSAGAGVCASTGVGALVAAVCGVGGIAVERSAVAAVSAVAALPAAPPSYCRGGVFQADQADAMGFAHATERTSGCAG